MLYNRMFLWTESLLFSNVSQERDLVELCVATLYDGRQLSDEGYDHYLVPLVRCSAAVLRLGES